MASCSPSLVGSVGASSGAEPPPVAPGAAADMAAASRRANLEFPPPPPYPPPHNGFEIESHALANGYPYRHRVVVRGAAARPLLQDYAYAYYEPPGPGSPTASAAALVRLDYQHPRQQHGQQQACRSAQAYPLLQQQQQQHRQDPQKRHTYVTRYGTEENIYEEISEIGRQCRRAALHGSRRSLVAEEVRRVQSRHQRVLGELNLSVEAMLMPTIADHQAIEGIGPDGQHQQQQQQPMGNASVDELLLHHPDELLSIPVGCAAADLDSGFSGSSSASYRSGLGSLRRCLDRTGTPELLSNGHLLGCSQRQQQQQQQRGSTGKTKAAMILKKGWKSWKKLQALGGASQKTGKSSFCLV